MADSLVQENIENSVDKTQLSSGALKKVQLTDVEIQEKNELDAAKKALTQGASVNADGLAELENVGKSESSLSQFFDVVSSSSKNDGVGDEPVLRNVIGVGKVDEKGNVVEQSVPIEQVVAPVVEQSVPVEQIVAPVVEQSVPVEQIVAPVVEQSVPVEQVVAPVVEQSVPVEQVVAPVVEQSVPVEQVVAPVVEQSVPIEQVVAPVVEQNVPLEQVAAPIDVSPDWMLEAAQNSKGGKIATVDDSVDSSVNVQKEQSSDVQNEQNVDKGIQNIENNNGQAIDEGQASNSQKVNPENLIDKQNTFNNINSKSLNKLVTIGDTCDVKDAAKFKSEKKRSWLFSFFSNKNKNKKSDKSIENSKKVNSKKSTSNSKERELLLESERVYQEGLASIKDLIAPASMEIQYDKLKIDGMYAQSFYVFSYPRYLEVNWLSPVVNFDVTMDISQFIYPISSSTIMHSLRRKVAQMQSTMRIQAEKGTVRDPALETALEDAEQLRTEIQRGQQKFFQVALYFTLYSEDEKVLQKNVKRLESLLSGQLVMTKHCQLQAEHGFNSSLPMCLDELYVIRNMNTDPLSTTFPFTSSDLTSDNGILYGINRHNESLIIFDRFDLENANSVVFAKSGAGKSYAVKLEILRLMMMGTDVIVVDPENEYEDLANTVGGTYLKMSLNSDRRINPFDLPVAVDGEDVQPGDLLRSSVINLHGLFKLMLGGVDPNEESLLDKAFMDVYALKGITMDLVNPASYEPPTMEDLYQVLSSMAGAESLVQRVYKFTHGTYAGIFNKQTNVNLESGMMVFSIRDLEDALRPIAMHIILNHIWNQVRSELKKRVLVIDEAWTMMQYEDSARFLFGLVKRARKYYLGVTTITQDVEDFMKSDFGKPIVTNSSMQLLLKQAPSSVGILADVFNLTEGERYVLLNSGIGQGLFFAGMKHVAVQIIASYTEDKIVTTNPEEILAERSE